MNKLLVNAPSGTQAIIEIGEGGGYFDVARVLWDEREDGPLPEITLGGMVRAGDVLVMDAATLAASATAELAPLQAAIIKQIDADVDLIYTAVIGSRVSEYTLAEEEALAYQAAGYPIIVPAGVQAWATAKGATATWAADSIIAVAAAWRTAQGSIRSARLLRKEQARNAVDSAALETVRTQWAGFVITTRAQLGL